MVFVQVPDLQLGPAARFANDSQLFFPVAALLESSVPDQSKGALQVCNMSIQRLASHTAILYARKLLKYAMAYKMSVLSSSCCHLLQARSASEHAAW